VRLVGYLRVSSESQLDGLGLEVQREGISRWATANGHEVVAWYTDAGVSGSNGVEGRHGLYLALNAIAEGVGEGLVVYRLDRLARQLGVQESTLAMVWKLSAHVFSVDGGEVLRDDPDDPTRTALRQMIGVFAQLERGMIVARLRAGRRAKADRGGYAGGGPPPFGWAAVEGELAEVPGEQATITRMRELAAAMTLKQVAATLNTEGRPAKRGGRWHTEQVRRVLHRAG
jgi:DNA invertase Pin-like site-specific DNA recombinase